jgi:bacterioferritin-associated ferredoxin
VARKVILCRCEDVTAADVEHAVRLGYADVEEVKRYTGFGTGPCQGKECLRGVVAAIATAAGRAAGEVTAPAPALAPFTSRPPLVPTELAVLAGGAAPAPPRPPRRR